MAIAITKDQEMAAHWKTQIEQADKATSKWHVRAKKICQNYRDERSEQDQSAGVVKRLNLFWSNVQTLKPVIYSKIPVPIVERRFLDKDTTGRMASTILERALRYEVAMSGFDSTMRRCRNDYLLPGRGQDWVRYNPQFGEPISPKQSADDVIEGGDGEPIDEAENEKNEEQEREFLSESLAVDYVHWQDFYTFPANARTWVEVEGVGRRLFMSRTDMKEAGFEAWKTIELDHPNKIDEEQGAKSLLTGQEGMQATIYEIWWKPERKVYFIAKSHDKVVKEADDPLKLEGFFPCPEPLSATMTNDTMIPVPDYAESQDQYIQIDDLTKRIDILTASTKVVGVYDAAAQSLKRVFEEAEEPNLIPVDSWAMFAEKGGIKGAIDWVPIEAISKTLQILIDVRAKIIEDLDRTTGISDIMRGTSDARETMGGQRLKTNNSSMRVSERQGEMARFARDTISIMGEIISEHFAPETLMQVSGAMYDEGLDPPTIPANPMMGHNGGPPLQPSAPPVQGPAPMPPQAAPPPGAMGAASPSPAGPQSMPSAMPMPHETPEQKQARKLDMISQAIMLLRQDKLRGFRIDIETDSTVQGDAEQEKAQRIEFLTATTKFIETAAQVTQLVPEFAPLAAKMLGFGVRGFRIGRDLESAIEDFSDKAEQDAKERALQPPQPSPEQQKAAAEIERVKIENAGEQANNSANIQMKQMDIEIARIKAAADVKSAEMDDRKVQRDDYYEQRRHEREEAKHRRDIERDDAMHRRTLEQSDHKHNTEMHSRSLEIDKKSAPLEQLHQKIDGLGEHLGTRLQRMHENIEMRLADLDAPAEIIRDSNGRAVGIKKGKKVLAVHRGADGRAERLQ